MQLSIKVHNSLLDLSLPRVMAIVNITPDSFYTSCKEMSKKHLLKHIEDLLNQGADIIDLGACSTRPNSTPISADEEWARLYPALQSIRAHFPDAILSIDTFRSDIAEKSIQMGADIINDVYGGDADSKMWQVIAKYRVPYVLTHSQVLLHLQNTTNYDQTVRYMLELFQFRLDQLHQMGIADVIIDPGFGFGKTELQNYTILNEMDVLSNLHVPIMVGISRKSMLYKPLGGTPAKVLPATIAANTIALERGASILRVHDVAAAKQAITIYKMTHNKTRKLCYSE
jgi:dihydropteroate synthase